MPVENSEHYFRNWAAVAILVVIFVVGLVGAVVSHLMGV